MCKLTIIRGLPGSGKSTLAHKLMSEAPYAHFEADMYFVKDGQYKFKPKLIKAAHEWTRLNTGLSLSLGRDVIVSNTFIKKWELNPYLKMARILNCEVKIIECRGDYGSVHNVPYKVLERMRQNWEEL